jgi:arsenical pump membrane protein
VADVVALPLALCVLAVTLAVAVARPRHLPEAVAAVAGALVLVALGTIGLSRAGVALRQLAPTVGFLAALLLIAEGCRREGLFGIMGEVMARRSRGDARRLLALVFAIASAVTIVLGLDATVVLLPPVVLATVARLRTNPKAPLYACAHLANSASLLLPVSNLTNLLAFHDSGLSFTRFALLMALPTAGAVGVEWAVISRRFPEARPASGAPAQGTERHSVERDRATGRPRFALAVLAMALAGFALSSVVSIAPVWIAVGGAVAINLPALADSPSAAVTLVRAAEPGFLVFVLGLGVIVAAASTHGLATAVSDVLPQGSSLPDLLLVALVSAGLANLVNNLPATLILVPVVAGFGAGPVLATLIGVNIGPNLTHVGSLATLLWRRVLRAQGVEFELKEFVALGVLTVPAALVAATALLWLALQL